MAVRTLEAIDRELVSPAVMADPYAAYAELRERAPVFWSESLGYWMLTRYDDARMVLRDPQTYVNRGRIARYLDQLPESQREMARPVYENFEVGIANTDPPDHRRIRGLISKAFTPQIVDGLRPRVQQVVDELLDPVQDDGQMDLIATLAYPLPAIILAEALGVPAEDRDLFKRFSDDIVNIHSSGRPDPDIVEQAAKSILEARAWIRELAAERRRHPEDDLLTVLVKAEDEGQLMSEAEMLATCISVLVAGHETTTGLIGNGMLALLRHPDQMQLLKDDPSLIPTAVEECLRYDSPFQRTWRLVDSDVEIRGQPIEKGQTVSVILGAACRDPDQFPEPDRFDVRREPNDHVAFGYGIRFCIGAPLGRREAEIAFATILRRFPDIRLGDGEIVWSPSSSFHNIRSLPLVWSANGAAARN